MIFCEPFDFLAVSSLPTEGLNYIADWSSTLAQRWHETKTFVEHSIAFSDDVLHVWVGVLLQLAVAAVTKRTISSWLPWLVVLGLELANEASDFRFERWPDLAMQAGESAKDVILTMLLPTVLLVVVRRAPRLFR